MARHRKTIAGDSSYRLHKIVFAISNKKNKNSKLLSIKYIKNDAFRDRITSSCIYRI